MQKYVCGDEILDVQFWCTFKFDFFSYGMGIIRFELYITNHLLNQLSMTSKKAIKNDDHT